jgi:CheY-like chemotaxis protein
MERVLAPHHDVTALSQARDALARIAGGERFDVILTDLMMPEMTGMDLHDELLRIAPDQAARLVFVSGGAFTVRARKFLDAVPNARLEKPIAIHTLLALIAGMLK